MIGRGIVATLVAVATLAVPGCGGDDDADEPKRPRLPADLATALALESDRIAESLAAGQECAAHRQAQALRAHVGDAVGRGDVAPALGREMSEGASALAEGIECEPAPPPEPEPAPAPTDCEAIVAQIEQLEQQAEEQGGGAFAGELMRQLREQLEAQCEGEDGDGEEESGPDGGPPGLEGIPDGGPPGLEGGPGPDGGSSGDGD
jgi:hypothetical protein